MSTSNFCAFQKKLKITIQQNCMKSKDVSALPLRSLHFWSWLIQLNRSYKYNGNFTRTGISTLNGHISKPVALREKLKKINCNYFSIFGLQFSTVHFLPFLAHMRPFSVIFWVLEVSHSVTFMPKYAPGSGKKKSTGRSKMSFCQQLL